MSKFFNTLIYYPLLNILVLFYAWLGDFGLAVIALTILIKVILYPVGLNAIRSQKKLTAIQPRVKAIQEKYKEDKEKQMQEMMAIYKEAKISPFSGLLPMIIQLPILISLYRLFYNGITDKSIEVLYPFIANPGQINYSFMGIVDLKSVCSVTTIGIIFAIVAGLLQYYQMKMMMVKNNQQGKGMLYFFPIFTVIILWRMPVAVALYWLTTTIFAIIQQKIALKQ
jgi:YidC/Oxa1 family membrane protein insertase